MGADAMSRLLLNHSLVMLAAYLLAFLQAKVTFFRDLVGAQPDLLPGLVLYVSLTGGGAQLMLVSLFGGLCLDSLSSNPLGISVLPLFLVGFLIRHNRHLLLRESLQTQWLLGAAAHAGVPLLTLVLLWLNHRTPLVGLFTLWQWVVMTLIGTAMTPVWFQVFDRLSGALNYQDEQSISFRPDRSIKRGRV